MKNALRRTLPLLSLVLIGMAIDRLPAELLAQTPENEKVQSTAEGMEVNSLYMEGTFAFSLPVDISKNTTYWAYDPRIVIDSSQTLHVVWNGGVDYPLYYAYRHRGESWAPPIELSTGSAVYPTLVIDSEDTLHLLWRGEVEIEDGVWVSRLMYSYKPSNRLWSDPVPLPPPPRFFDFDIFTIAATVDSFDTLHVVWDLNYAVKRNIMLYTYKPKDGDWSEPMEVLTGRFGQDIVPEEDGDIQPYNFIGPDLTIGPDDTLHLVWQGSPEWNVTNAQVRYAFKPLGEPWEIIGTIYERKEDGRELFSPTILCAPDGELIVIFEQYFDPETSQVRIMRKPPLGNWTEPLNITDMPSLSQNPRIEVDGQGNIHLLWSQYVANESYNMIYYRFYSRSKKRWSDPTVIPYGYGYMPWSVLDSSDRLHVVWEGGGPLIDFYGHHIYYSFAPTPKLVLLANSIDYSLASDFLGFLRNEGLDVFYVTAPDFDQYKTEKFIVILGGPDAYEGVDEIIQQVLNKSEQDWLRIKGNRKMYVKTNVWRQGQVVMVIAGSDRWQTQKAGEENKLDVKNRIWENL